MKLLCCLTLSALFALGGTGDGKSTPLRIYVDFQRGTSPAVDAAMRQELASLVEPIGARLEWKALANPGRDDTSSALVVTTFKGGCNTVGLDARRVVPGALAWTHISDGVILPFIDVDCERMRAFLQSHLVQIDAKRRDRLFGRAVARVLGHELYHVFADTVHHGKEGVAQPAFTAHELLSDNFDFAEKEFRTLRDGRLGTLLSLAKPGGTGYVYQGCGACHGACGEGSHFGPPLRATAKTVDLKALAVRFEKKREEMFRRARNLKFAWQFPSDDEVREIVTHLAEDLE